jgi:hypothetical protein
VLPPPALHPTSHSIPNSNSNSKITTKITNSSRTEVLAAQVQSEATPTPTVQDYTEQMSLQML